MQGNVPAIRSRYISHRHVWKTCPRDMVKSHCVGSHLAGIWLSQGYNARISPRAMWGNVPGTRGTYISHRYAAKICPRDIVKSQSVHRAGLKNSKIRNQPNAKDAADLISSDGDEKHSRMATARSLWLLRSLQDTELSLNHSFQYSNVDQQTYASVITFVYLFACSLLSRSLLAGSS